MRRVIEILAAALMLAACADKGPAEKQASAPAAPAAAPGQTVIEVPSFEVSKKAEDIAKGQEAFANKGCTACHKIGGGKLVGPDLKGVTARRDETWIKKMILRPDVMVKEDATARKLLTEYLTPMPNQGVDPAQDLPVILAYLKSNE
jgi:mono/diheme cytochrome c family protein